MSNSKMSSESELITSRRQILRNFGLAAAGVSASTMAVRHGATPISDPGTPLRNVSDPSFIDPSFDSRSVSFENPTGARGMGGQARGGRKGAMERVLKPGEKVVLADLKGPGTVRHIWMAINIGPPEIMRSLQLEVFYDGASEPSVSVPVLDFFGLPHGRCAEFYSSLICVNEGRGFNSFIPMPFDRSVRVEFSNGSPLLTDLAYQIDYTLEPSLSEHTGYLHAAFRRENPTTRRRDFVIADGLKGPGRFLGCVVGVRVIDKVGWYGEGEVKIYRDGDRDFPTYCGTGLEDYVGGAWGLDRHYGPYSGAPLNICLPPTSTAPVPTPVFVGFYRWHLLDPVMFAQDLRVTIQQIGYASFKKGQEAEFAAYKVDHPTACYGWERAGVDEFVAWVPPDDNLAEGCVERSDDYCATAFVYCSKPQSVPRLDAAAAARDIARLPFEQKIL
jgi:hypothetical protein